MRKWTKPFIVYCLIISFLGAPVAEARSVLGRKALVVGKAALYGLGGGLVIGLASQVVSSKPKNIFLGGSLGMYVGILTGLYLVMTAGSGSKEYEGPDTYEDFNGWDSHLYAPPREAQQAMNADQKMELTIFSKSF